MKTTLIAQQSISLRPLPRCWQSQPAAMQHVSYVPLHVTCFNSARLTRYSFLSHSFTLRSIGNRLYSCQQTRDLLGPPAQRL